jgi:hypothetical protein
MPQVRAIVPDNGGVQAGHNTTVSTIEKHRLVKRSTATDSITPAVDGAAVIYGVTMAAIAANYAGDVQKAGRAIVEAGEAIDIGEPVTGGTGGKGAVAAAEEFYFGIANTAGEDGDLIEVDINPSVLPA